MGDAGVDVAFPVLTWRADQDVGGPDTVDVADRYRPTEVVAGFGEGSGDAVLGEDQAVALADSTVRVAEEDGDGARLRLRVDGRVRVADDRVVVTIPVHVELTGCRGTGDGLPGCGLSRHADQDRGADGRDDGEHSGQDVADSTLHVGSPLGCANPSSGG